MTEMLRLEDLSKDMGEFALKEISLTVQEGEYLVVIGPTGAGKTILLETIAGIYPPDKGRIFMDGGEITHMPPRERKIAMVYQDFMLFPHLTVGENIAFGMKLAKKSTEECSSRVSETAALLGITHLLHRYPDTLSGGEKQRAAIARAVVLDPRLLLLDEPLSALDGQTRSALRAELRRLHSLFSMTIIHITHNFEEVFSLADRVAVMKDGEILQNGCPDDIFRRPADEFIARFVGVGNLFSGTCRSEEDLSVVEVDGGHRIRTVACAPEGKVFLSVRPEDILISRRPVDSSAQNMMKGTIISIADNGAILKIEVDAGLLFEVVVTRQGWERLSLSRGDEVYLTFKASSVHVF